MSTSPSPAPFAADFTVSDMTCGHCVASVTEEVRALDGVTDVEVDLATGRVRVRAVRPVPADAVRGAVEAAGYRLT